MTINIAESPIPTPYAVNCICNNFGLVYMTLKNYREQMINPDYKWNCPHCGRTAEWSDSNYESFVE